MPAPVAAVQYQHPQPGREARRLAPPVEDQAGRRNHQRRTIEPTFVLFDLQMRERLQGLAETHVIGEHTAETALAQQLQPGQAFVLIAAQLENGRASCRERVVQYV